MSIDLTRLKQGDKGIVVDIQGGWGLLKKLDGLGIKTGTEVVKISSQLLRGPVTIRIGNTQVAIGFGMARKIIVERK